PGAITMHNFPTALQEFLLENGARIDLAATDLLRDRERGVPRYNDFREMLHRGRARSFEDLTGANLSGAAPFRKQWAEEIREVYDDEIDMVDTQIGLLAEPFPKGFGFSDTAFRIFVLMAPRRLKSDRFLSIDFTPEVYTDEGINWVKKNTMVSVLIRHHPALEPVLRDVENAFAPWPGAPD
ncbi:MAG: peroxidase, partial [Acidobacteria bacterium]|nr:peroxidase [Acidobacteriota bacterium]